MLGCRDEPFFLTPNSLGGTAMTGLYYLCPLNNQVFTHTGHVVHPQEDTLANAAAAMYCYLSENNLLPE